jgi:hypothetical protein
MTARQTKHATPRGLKPAGRQLWDSVLDQFELEEYERSLLLQCCQTADIIADLQATIETLGVDCAGRELAEIRQQRLTFARLVVALRLPNGLEEDGRERRPQRRGIRGVYRLPGGARDASA